jgi:hypothetical protein
MRKPSVVRSRTPRTLIRLVGHPAGHGEEAVARVRAPPDATAQLVELRQAEAIGVLDRDHRRVRDVDADLDHGRRHEHVEAAGREAPHDAVLLVGLHATVQ